MAKSGIALSVKLSHKKIKRLDSLINFKILNLFVSPISFGETEPDII